MDSVPTTGVSDLPMDVTRLFVIQVVFTTALSHVRVLLHYICMLLACLYMLCVILLWAKCISKEYTLCGVLQDL